MKNWVLLAVVAISLTLFGCGPRTAKNDVSTDIQYEKYTLDNGLDVILHVDRSDPIVAINLAVHVGSARELPGRTGFAHLFEHLLFMDSENLGFGGLDEMNTRIGGDGTNGFTTNDMTQYFQAVPMDALEKIIWAEADKIGYFINTVTQNVIDKEKQVVKNEKRQRVDNRPYGHRWYIIGKALYTNDHPYNWQVIGSLEDLDAATLSDVQAFYKKWYVPNNVTVTLAGNFDVAEAKVWIEKYFGDIPRGEDVARPAPRPSSLGATVSLYYEDNFAATPEMGMIWPSVPQYHADRPALDMLATYLGDGKKAPFNEVMTDEEKVTSSISIFTSNSEIAGEFYIIIDSKEGEDLDGLVGGIAKSFARFEKDGITDGDLNLIKIEAEVEFYDGLQSALGKAIGLGEANTFTGNPGFVNQELKNIQAVTPADIMRVYNKYIKNRPHVLTSIVPKGAIDLTLDGAVLAPIVEEIVVQGAEDEASADDTRDFPRTASSFDRTLEPAFGPAYELASPDVWQGELKNGVSTYGIESHETSLVYFSLSIDAGRERGDVSKPAVANLTGDMLELGTQQHTNAEFEDALSELGSSLSISVGAERTVISGYSLARNFDATIDLMSEMLLSPRWDEEEFSLLMVERIDAVAQAAGDPASIARREDVALRYPENHMFHYTSYGGKAGLERVSLDDLKTFYTKNYAPARAQLRVVGAVSQQQVSAAFADLGARWNTPPTADISLPQSANIERAKIYFYDIPGSKQSILRIKRPSLTALDPDYALAEAINFPLGGIYTSQLMTQLRLNKGYTYGIRSGFSGGVDRGVFSISSSVRTNVTLEAMTTIRDIVNAYGPEFTQDNLDVMKEALLRGQALKNETLSDKLSMVTNMSAYGYAANYRAQNAARIKAMTLPEFKALAAKYLRADAMYYLVVGDAASQAGRLGALGYGDPVMLNGED